MHRFIGSLGYTAIQDVAEPSACPDAWNGISGSSTESGAAADGLSAVRPPETWSTEIWPTETRPTKNWRSRSRRRPPHLERRHGEAILIGAGERREWPADGVRVLMLGGEPADVMLEGLVLGDLAEIGHLESATEPSAAMEAILETPGRYDLVLVSRRVQRIDAFAFAGWLERRASARATRDRLPLLVLMAEHFTATDIARSEACGAFAARLLKPLCHDHCRGLIARLFRR